MKPNPKLLVIDGDRGIRRLLRTVLEPLGYDVWEAGSGSIGLQMAAEKKPDLIILETLLPDVDGLLVLQSLREWSDTPVLVLSERKGDNEKVAALDNGADDYVIKPFSNAEVLARLRVLRRPLRRAPEGPFLIEGDLTINLTAHSVTFMGRPIQFTPIEEALFYVLVRYFGKVVTIPHLLRSVWGPAADDGVPTLRSHIGNLRKKLEACDSRIQIKTKEGLGYCLHRNGSEAQPAI